MPYIEGFVIPVPRSARDAFVAYAREFDAIFLEHGATRVWECWGEDVKRGKQTDFYRAVDAREDEATVFSWIEWPDRATRDAQMEKLMQVMQTDPRWDAERNPPPFDGARMIYGGFEPVVMMEKPA